MLSSEVCRGFSGKVEEYCGSLKTGSLSGDVSSDYPPNANMVAMY
jgi:hypothetical protein